jgi:hypothetical protein
VGQDDAAEAAGPAASTPESAASFSRAQSTTTAPPDWKNTVSSISWPRQPSAS